VTAYSHGLNAAEHARLMVYMREFGVHSDPIYQALQHVPNQNVVRRRTELVSDRDWYRSPAFNDYRRPCDADHQLTSLVKFTSTGATSCLALHRSVRDRDFSDRECALASLFHVELGRLIGRSLTSAIDGPSKSLSPRLRQTLACLLEGDSEKQVALRMGISRTTVHQYVTELYRLHDVHSRAELLARMLRQRPKT
jgi:DNA-binding CsgD family transcriptional regulator